MKQLTENIAFLLGLVIAVAMLLLYSAVFHAKVIAPRQELEDMELQARLAGIETRVTLLTRAVGGQAATETPTAPIEVPGEDLEPYSGPEPPEVVLPADVEEALTTEDDLTTRLILLEQRLAGIEALPEAPAEVTSDDLAALRIALMLMEIKVDMAAGDYGSADARLDALKARDLTAWPALAERLAAMGPIKPETRSRAILDLNLSLEEIVSLVGD